MYSYSKFEHNHTKSSYKYVPPVSEDYRVFLNGEEIPVYTCRISAYPFNRVWPGFQRPVDQTETASYVNIVSDEEIRLEVVTRLSCEKIMIKPYSKNIEHTVSNGKIKFSLKENGQFVLECGSYHNCLYIFNSKPISAPEKSDVTYYFDKGIHFPGKITLCDNESVYVDKDALVFGCVYAENAKNLRIFGNGIFDDSHEERTGNYCYEDYVNGNIKFYDCSDITVEGVGMQNSAIWCLNIFNCKNVSVNDIKIFGQWRYNTDGIDIVNSDNINITDSFIHSFDDTITVKGIDRYCAHNNENIHIDNCVLWCDWGKPCEIGIETECREYKNISFTNCDILRGGCAVLDISNGDCAEISDIVFENINIEYEAFYTPEQYQGKDDDKYTLQDEIAVPHLFQIRNTEWRSPVNMKLWGLPPRPEIDMSDLSPKSVHDVKVNNINIFASDEMLADLKSPLLTVHIKSTADGIAFRNINISNIFLNGKPVNPDEIPNMDYDR